MLKSGIKIEANEDNGRTYLGKSFHNAPYKVVHYGGKNLHEHLEMMIMCSSPGMMEGDELHIDVTVGENAHLRLYTQSFNKLHPMKEKGATQRTKVKMNQGSVFQYIPHPVTPYANSIFQAVNEVEMHSHATLIWGDIIASGRVHMGESFEFKRLHSLTKVWVNRKLMLFDNQLLEPESQSLKSLLYYENYTHQSTLIYMSPYANELKEELDEILIGQYQEITFGFTQCASNGIMLRAMGNDGELLYDWMTGMGRLCWEFTQHKIDSGKDQKVPEIEDKEKQSEETGLNPGKKKAAILKKERAKPALPQPEKQLS